MTTFPGADQAATIPVSVLTGFLGSGKTTVLSRLLRDKRMARAAVVINEFGEVGLDHVLVEQSGDGIVELQSGCICCTIKSDLIDTLRTLYFRRARGEIMSFDRVLIETTGLADPAPILQALMADPILSAYYHLEAVIATVDAVNGDSTLDQHQEAVKQAAVADRLLVTKTDLVEPAEVAQIIQRLTVLNPTAPILTVRQGEVDPALLFQPARYDPAAKSAAVRDWLRDEALIDHDYYHDRHNHDHSGHDHAGHSHDHSKPDVNRHDERIRSFAVVREQPISWASLTAWLDLLVGMRGDDLLRVKGILNLTDSPGRPIVIHGVQQVFHPPVALDRWPSDDHRSRIVFITRDIDPAMIEDTLMLFDIADQQTA
jgi:G3E family GTPase